MSLILNIDTSTQVASICLTKDSNALSMMENQDQKDHARWLHAAIEELIKSGGYKLNDLNAVAVTNGPGSYTGLRIGLSAAKGFCYALQIPLITEGTLKVMAFAAISQIQEGKDLLFCPMIDARRNEVFTALYNRELKELISPVAMVLHENSFEDELLRSKICFFGSGNLKWQNMHRSYNSIFHNIIFNATHLGILAYEKFIHQQFTEILYSQPAYMKDFHTYNK